MYFPLSVGVLCLSLFCYSLLCVHSSFAIILKRKRKVVALQLLPYRCIVTINVMRLFLAVPWVAMQCVILVFPYHTHFLQCIQCSPRQYIQKLQAHTQTYFTFGINTINCVVVVPIRIHPDMTPYIVTCFSNSKDNVRATALRTTTL